MIYNLPYELDIVLAQHADDVPETDSKNDKLFKDLKTEGIINRENMDGECHDDCYPASIIKLYLFS